MAKTAAPARRSAPKPAAAPATEAKTAVVVEGAPLVDPLKAARDAAPRRVGAPHHPLTGKVENPPITEAQLAAGPHRPEPARQVSHDPGYSVPAAVPGAIDLDAPIKWVKVRATRDGFTGVGAAGVRRRAGDVFMVDDRFFSKTWMELVPESTPEGRKTSQQVINEKHDELLGGTAPRPAAASSVI